jgi:hypothetical protein
MLRALTPAPAFVDTSVVKHWFIDSLVRAEGRVFPDYVGRARYRDRDVQGQGAQATCYFVSRDSSASSSSDATILMRSIR